MTNMYISSICDLLNIEKPTISHNTSAFESDTMMAQYDPENSTIYIKEAAEPNPDYLFAIAHELRHIWQIEDDNDFFFSEYKPRKLMPSTKDYNLQIAEVDANAFAAIILLEYFGLQPLWNGLDKSVVNAIEKRMNFLYENEFYY